MFLEAQAALLPGSMAQGVEEEVEGNADAKTGVEPGEGKGGAPPIQPLPHILPLPLGRCLPRATSPLWATASEAPNKAKNQGYLADG